jgi:hypothetical protein
MVNSTVGMAWWDSEGFIPLRAFEQARGCGKTECAARYMDYLIREDHRRLLMMETPRCCGKSEWFKRMASYYELAKTEARINSSGWVETTSVYKFKRKEDDMGFTKKDLKDGMVVTYRNSAVRVVMGVRLFAMSAYGGGSIDDFSLGFNHLHGDGDFDIIKVTYMGEVLWEREEWVDVTPLEAMAALLKKGGELDCKLKDGPREEWRSTKLFGSILGFDDDPDGYPFRGEDEGFLYCQLKKSDLV